MKRSRKEVLSSSAEAQDIEETRAKQAKLSENGSHEIHQLSASMSSEQHQVNKEKIENNASRTCPYLDTVNRDMLDFDYEKKCSVSLSTTNVYCCLVCGKYFQGRTLNTYASKHSMEMDHHVFISMKNGRIYCLPDDYEVFDSSLNDIKQNVMLSIPADAIALLDQREITVTTLDSKTAIQGVMGMNNLHSGDAANAVLQCLTHLPKLRNFLLDESLYTFDDKPASDLLARLGNLTRRIWNPHPWRLSVSPHELLQEVSNRSDGKYGVGIQCDPIDFYSWIINTLHRDLLSRRTTKKITSSAISDLFQGLVTIHSEKMASKRRPTPEPESSSMDIETSASTPNESSNVVTTKTTPFFHLQFDLPTVTLLKDEKTKTTSLQVPIFTLLSKFDGNTDQYVPTTKENRKFKIQKLPHILVFYVKRFTQNMYLVEKNKTIVNFPVDELDMSEYTDEKSNTKYTLSAYICHTGDTPNGSCIARYYHKATRKWFNCQGTTVDAMIADDHFVAEAYIMFYEQITQ